MKRLSIVIVGIIFLVGLLAAWWINGTSPANPVNTTPQTFVVEKGQGIREIANKLKSEGLIKDPVIFFLLVKQLGIDSKIQAGSFRFNPAMNANEIANGLTVGTTDVWITVPEGKRAEEIAEILQENFETYDESWKTTLSENEGYLFPDTYLFPKEATIDLIVQTMRDTFEQKFNTLDLTQTGLTREEIVTLASLVEREAKHQEDRPIVASVMLNRLDIGMPLQIDATVQYALGYQPNEDSWWKQGLTFDDLEINSPYNTYQNQGMPPGPIANPGIRVMEAVVNPASTNYLYYITDKSGTNRYAETLDEHNANIKTYGL